MKYPPRIHKDRPIPFWAKAYCKAKGITTKPAKGHKR